MRRRVGDLYLPFSSVSPPQHQPLRSPFQRLDRFDIPESLVPTSLGPGCLLP